MCYLPNEEKRLRRWANSMGRIAITATQNGLILEAANPISLCVEFLALWRGNIRPGVGKLPMSRTGQARNVFHLMGNNRRERRTREP